MKKSFIFKALVLLSSTIILAGCNSDEPEQSEKPLNVTILLDLSDRVVRDNVNPCQKERDMAIVNYMVDKFKNAVKGNKLSIRKDRMKVMFYPTPDISQVQIVSKNLDVNLAKLQPAEKKKALMGMDTVFSEGLNLIYNQTISTKKWVGCDIWSFFSNGKVDNFCMADSARNILIILTDGYLYHKDNIVREGNNYSYLSPRELQNNPNAELIVKRKGLENLEVLFLEINELHQQEELIKNKLGNWLEGMGIQKYQVVPTDLPNNIEDVIDQFIGF